MVWSYRAMDVRRQIQENKFKVRLRFIVQQVNNRKSKYLQLLFVTLYLFSKDIY